MTNTDLIAKAKAVIANEALAIQALAGQMDENLIDVANLLLNCKGHVMVSGMGTSGAVARRFAHLLSCSGIPAMFFSAADGLHGASGAITANDVVFIISKGGRSDELNQFAEIAKSRGAKIVAQTEKPDSPLGQMSDAVYKVKLVGDVDPYGMIATGTSLVNAVAGDVLCVLLLELGGYTKESFGQTHPGGAVGVTLEKEAK